MNCFRPPVYREPVPFPRQMKLQFFKKKKQPRLTITLPEPCSEEWAKMRVVDNSHRHCEACERTLTDFAQMNDDELMLFFKHSQGNICGRFRKDQLNRPLTPLPEKTSKATWWKAAALLPLTLFSKNTSAQQIQPDSTKTEQGAPGITLEPSDSAYHEVAANPVWPNDSILPPFSIIDINEEYHMGGVPMISWELEWPPLYTISFISTAADTLFVSKPKTDSALGAEAAAASVPVNKPAAPKSANAALNFQAIVPDSTRNK